MAVLASAQGGHETIAVTTVVHVGQLRQRCVFSTNFVTDDVSETDNRDGESCVSSMKRQEKRSNCSHTISMGQVIDKLVENFRSFFKAKEVKSLMLGLDAAGKTTILYKLKLGENIVTIPTNGLNAESVQHEKLRLTILDMSGQDRIRVLWRYYYAHTDAVIFVVDSSDSVRFETACKELHQVMSDSELSDAKMLLFANKQDITGAADSKKMREELQLARIKQDWFLQPCCATDGEGLFDGLEWLNSVL